MQLQRTSSAVTGCPIAEAGFGADLHAEPETVGSYCQALGEDTAQAEGLGVEHGERLDHLIDDATAGQVSVEDTGRSSPRPLRQFADLARRCD
jgi:hypothetical protein